MPASNSSRSKSVSVILPAFREEATVGELVRALKSLGCVQQILVVDDGSDDRTAEIAQAAGAEVLTHPYNIGNGAAVKTGIRNAQGDLLVLMDADGQHDPQQIPALLARTETYDMVVGSRSFAGQSSLPRWFANRFYNALASYVTRFPVKDLTSGFRVIRAPLARRFLYLLPNTFSYPSTLTLSVLRSGFSVAYVPIEVRQRSIGSKIRPIRDGTRFFLIILKVTMLFSPLRIFFPVSLAMAASGLLNYLYTFMMFHRFTNMSALLGMSSVLTFMLGLIAEQVSLLRMERSEIEQK